MAGAYVGSLLTLGLALIWFVVEPQSSGGRMLSRANIANVHVLVLEKRRSGESSNVVQLSSADQKFVLLLDLYPPILTAYEMQIARTDASKPVPIPRIDGLIPDQNERLSVVLDANLLPPGEYLVSFFGAEGGSQQQALDRFELSVRGPAEN